MWWIFSAVDVFYTVLSHICTQQTVQRPGTVKNTQFFNTARAEASGWQVPGRPRNQRLFIGLKFLTGKIGGRK
jgi:hypothetical protein